MMFTVRIADVFIGIDNRYDFVRTQCAQYICSGTPLFTVSVSEDEIDGEISLCTDEVRATAEDLRGYCESICVLRKISFELTESGGILFHGAAVMYKGRAYLFTASSGTGKTTHLNLWMKLFGRDLVIINGDKPIIRDINGTMTVYGTPWSGKEGLQTPICAPVGGICFLRRSAENSIRKITPLEASPLAMKQILYPSDPAQLLASLRLLDKLICDSPLYLLSCNISDEAAKLSFSAMTGEKI